MPITETIKGLLVATAAATLLGCAGDSAEDHLQNSQRYLAEGDKAAAVLELKSALQKDQNLARARWLLGNTYLQQGDTASAAKELQRALWLDWDSNQVIPAYAAALTAEEQYADVIKLSEDGLTDDALASLYTSKALAKIALGENSDGADYIRKSLALDPRNAKTLLASVQLDINLGNLEQAAASLEELTAAHPDNARAWFATGELLSLQKKPDEAALAYDRVLELEPDNFVALRKRTLLAMYAGDVKTGRAGARTLLQANHKDPLANLVMGVLNLRDGKIELAVKRLSLAEPVSQAYPLVNFFLGAAHLADNNLEQAVAYASRFQAIAPASVRGRKLLATIYLQQGEYPQVVDLLRPVIEQNGDDVDSLRLMANAQLRRGESSEAIALLARVAELEPDSAAARISLGAGLLVSGQAADAEHQLEAALQLDPGFRQGDLLLVLSQVQQGNFEAALQAADDFAARQPEQTTPQNLIGWIHARQGDTTAAAAAYRRALALDPGDRGANHALARLALQQGDLKAASGYYDTILEHHPDNLRAQLQLALIDAEQGDNEALVKRLQGSIESRPQALEPRLLLARHYLRQERPDKVSTVFLGLDATRRQDPRVLQLMAFAQLDSAQHSEALYTLEQLTDSEPDSAPYHYLTALAAAGGGDAELVERELDKALALDPRFNAARLARAKLMLRLDRDEEFRQELATLRDRMPGDTEVLLLQAAAASRDERYDEAVNFAERAYRQTPTPKTLRTFAQALERSGAGKQAAAVYTSWLEEHPDDVLARLQRADNTMAAGGDASDEYARVLELEPDNLVALNNLAWLLRETSPQRALQYARRASELDADNPFVLDTLAVTELLNGNLEQAARSVDRALDALPEEPNILYHRAMIERASGEDDDARRTLEQVLQGDTAFTERAEAEALYRELQR